MEDVLQKPATDYEPRGHLDPAGFERHISLRRYSPPGDLAPFIDHFWTLRWNEAIDRPYISEQVMHRPYVDVYISAQESGIQGTFRAKRAYVAVGSGRIIGARFRPGAFHVFWDGTLADLQDTTIGLQQVFPGADDRYTKQLLAQDDDTAVLTLMQLVRDASPRPDPNVELINEIIAAIETDDHQKTVKAVARRFRRSERSLQRLFQDYVGVGLKWLLQRHRLLTAAERIRESDRPDWVAIAYDLGYSSQQHFISDFKRALGKTPVEYKNDLTPPE